MSIKGVRVSVRCILCAAALLVLVSAGGCGGHKQSSVVSFQSSDRSGGLPQHRVAPPFQAVTDASLDEALAELDALETPEAVDAALFEELKDALEEALLCRARTNISGAGVSPANHLNHGRDARATSGVPCKFASTPPTGEANKVTDLAYGAEGEFTEAAWVPLAVAASGERLLISSPHTLNVEKPFVRVVPYDSGGGEGVPSVPLEVAGEAPHVSTLDPRFGVAGSEVTFTAAVSGAAPLYYAWDFGGGAEPNESSEPLPTVTLAAEGDYNAVLTLHNIFGSDECPFLLSTGVPPEIVEVAPTEGDYGREVEFSAVVTGTEPITYAWDFGSGAEPNVSEEAAPTVVLGETGDYDASVTATSRFGIDRREFNLHVLGWHIELVDNEGPVGYFASLKLDSAERPHVAYVFDDSGIVVFLKYAYRDETGWHVEVVDDEGDVGWSCSLALDSLDHPHISYWDGQDEFSKPTDDLNYAYHDGSSWHIETVDSAGKVGGSSSLALDSLDRPRISYRDSEDEFHEPTGDLNYAYYDGSSWHIETVDSEGNVGDGSSLALDSLEYPHIAYSDDSKKNLKYAYYDGTGWHFERADSELNTGHSISLALDSLDRPHIGHGLMGIGIRDIKYSYYDGSEWRNELLDYERRVLYPSLALDAADHPHIAHQANDPYELLYTYYDGAVWSVETIDVSGWNEPSLVLDSLDRPHVCYYLERWPDNELYYAAYY